MRSDEITGRPLPSPGPEGIAVSTRTAPGPDVSRGRGYRETGLPGFVRGTLGSPWPGTGILNAAELVDPRRDISATWEHWSRPGAGRGRQVSIPHGPGAGWPGPVRLLRQ